MGGVAGAARGRSNGWVLLNGGSFRNYFNYLYQGQTGPDRDRNSGAAAKQTKPKNHQKKVAPKGGREQYELFPPEDLGDRWGDFRTCWQTCPNVVGKLRGRFTPGQKVLAIGQKSWQLPPCLSKPGKGGGRGQKKVETIIVGPPSLELILTLARAIRRIGKTMNDNGLRIAFSSDGGSTLS